MTFFPLKTLAFAMTLALALVSAPASALANDLAAGGQLAPQGAGESSTIIETSGQAKGIIPERFKFTTSDALSVYTVRVDCHQTGIWARVIVSDEQGGNVGDFSTRTASSRYYPLAKNATYTVTVQPIYNIDLESALGSTLDFAKLAEYRAQYANRALDFGLTVLETPSKPYHDPLGTDYEHPETLEFGKPVTSQFDEPVKHDSTEQPTQWFAFTADDSHSVYTVQLESLTKNQEFTCEVKRAEGANAGETVKTLRAGSGPSNLKLLLEPGPYLLAISAGYSNKPAFPSYRVAVFETQSTPYHTALGTNREQPYQLKLGKTYASQFDDPTDSAHQQWLTFKTSGNDGPYSIALASETTNKTVSWELFDSTGSSIATASTSTTRADAVRLAAKTRYTLAVTSYYNASVGYPSYHIGVTYVKPGKVARLSLTSSKRTVTARFDAAENATSYQVSYKKASAKKWKKPITTAAKKRTFSKLSVNTRYNVRVRAVYSMGGDNYYGKWTTGSIKTKR